MGLEYDDGHIQRDAGNGGEGDRPAGFPQAPERMRAPRAAISASALRPSPSAPATAAQRSRRAAWRSRRAGKRSIMTVDPSGFVEARIGSSPHGQGLRTTLAQIIADEIGVTPEMIKVVHGDTDRTPYGWGTFASRSLVISGGATLIAAQKIRAKLDQDRQPPARGGARGHCARGRNGEGRRHRPHDPDRKARARGLYANSSVQGRHRAGTDGNAATTIRPAPSPMPAISRSSMSTSRRVM